MTPDNVSAQLTDYQREFVAVILDSLPTGRILLSAAPGAGKSVAIAAALRELRSRLGASMRTLLISPSAALASQWQDTLRRVADVESIVLDGTTWRVLADGARKPETNLSAVGSIRFLSLQNRWSEVVKQSWNVVILDSVDAFPRSDKVNRILEYCWDQTDGLVVASMSKSAIPPWLKSRGRHDVRWSLSKIIPRLGLQQLIFVRGITETRVLNEVSLLIRDLKDQIRTPISRFMAELIERRAQSSVFALEQALSRHLTRLDLEKPDELLLESLEGGSDVWELDRMALRRGIFTDEPESSPPSFAVKRGIESSMRRILNLAEEIDRDSKWDRVTQFLDGERRPVLFFTDFLDTAEYVTSLLFDRAAPATMVSTRMTPQERREAIAASLSRQSPIVATTASIVWGPPIEHRRVVVHYDVPDSSQNLSRRLDAVSGPGVEHYVVVSSRGNDAENLAALVPEVAS